MRYKTTKKYIYNITSYRATSYQYFVVDTLCERQPLENLTEELEHLGSVLSFDFSFKTIHLVHVVCLMVAFK